ncbi:hypothetical protein C8J57DRAFT_1286279 [Mycena rebaudengoi]|nr:hypothetical protein C8J57DRAFT_1286279 [Mycena rebaudengoi]
MDQDDIAMPAEDALSSLLRKWLLDPATGKSESSIRRYARLDDVCLWEHLKQVDNQHPPNADLRSIIYDSEKSELKGFHPLAALQDRYNPQSGLDVFEFIADLWDPEVLLIPPEMDEKFLQLLRMWLRDLESDLDGPARSIRNVIEEHPRPPEPLLGQLFSRNRLKLFHNPEKVRGDDDVYEHLAAMWQPPADPIAPAQNVTLLRSKEQADRLFIKMTDEFIGSGAKHFAQGMNEYHSMWTESPTSFYGRIVAIAAPSGLGKTKMTLEYLKDHPGVYICLRPESHTPAQGWPPGDEPITKFLLKHERKQPIFVSAALLTALLSCAEETYHSSSSIEAHNALWQHKRGSQIGRDHRKHQLAQVAVMAEELVQKHHPTFRARIEKLPKPTEHQITQAAIDNVCGDTVKHLAERTPGLTCVIDECTALPHLYPEHVMSPLLRAMEGLSDCDVWFVQASTSSKITSIVPSMEGEASQRFSHKTSMPPWFYLPFEPFLERRPVPQTIASGLLVEELQFTGRPLWQVYTPDEVIPIAAVKLLNNAKIDGTTKLWKSDDCIFALYSQRICLSLNPSASSQLVEAKAIESHMRRNMLMTSCPSEPILALGAAIAMNSTADNRRELPDALIKLVTKHRVDRGLEGELYSRLVLLMARDACNNHLTGLNTFVKRTDKGLSLRTVTLDSVLQALLRETSIPTKYEDTWQEIKRTLEGVHITFTHFLELDVDVAVLDSQWCFDILCRDLELPFDETKLHLVCYQAKARTKAAAAELAECLTCPMVRYQDGTIVKPEHTLLLIDMATTSRYRDGRGYVQVSQRAATRQGKAKNWQGYSFFHNIDETAGNFIGIRGLEPYQVLSGVDTSSLYSTPARAQYSRLVTCLPRQLGDGADDD